MAVFLGNAPSSLFNPFAFAASGFTIYYLKDRAGFTSPRWYGNLAIQIDQRVYPAALWLLDHGFAYDSALDQDADGDGVSLLMAYALDLDPRLNLQGRLPAPEIGANILSVRFHATSLGIAYRVETSTDLQDWTSVGVMQSPPGPDGLSIASVSGDGPVRFVRLVVEH